MNLKPYPKYKDSGIEWLGKVPEGWEVKRLKWLASLEYGSSLSEDDREEGDVPVYGSNGIVGKHSKSITGSPAIIIGRKGSYGKVSYSEAPCFPIDTTYYIDPSLTKENIRWIYYLLSSINLDEITFDTGVPGLSREFAYSKIVPVPIQKEQSTISTFLDHKTSKIDNLIKKNEQLIELLKEKRQAIISHAVIKGIPLHPPLEKGGWGDLKMKDSGVKWIGKIPEGWEVKKIKYTSYIKGRVGWHGLRSDEFTDEGPFLVTGTDFISDKVNWETCYHISDERYNQDPYIQLRENDLLITKDGTIGKVALVKNLPDRATLNSGIMLIRPITKDYCTDFMFWILNSKVFSEYNEHTKTGSTIQHLYQETFENFIFSVPHIDEQKNICAYLTQKTAHVDGTIKKILAQIETLKEYRRTLISNVVTGKVKIC